MQVSDEQHVVAVATGLPGFPDPAERAIAGERFVAGLRALLRARVPATSLRVVALPDVGAGALASRQELLARHLTGLAERYDQPRVHLVGHGVGGLDAALLGRRNPLVAGPSGTSVFSPAAMPVFGIDSVTTIAAPLYGTTLAWAPFPRISPGLTGRSSFRDFFVRRFGTTVVPRGSTPFTTALAALRDEQRLRLAEPLVAKSALLRDLDPAVAAGLFTEDNRRPEIAWFCVACLAPRPGRGIEGTRPDRLYADLFRWAAEHGTRPGSVSPPPVPAFRAADVIASRPDLAPELILPEDSDGVVNTARQIDPRATFAGFAVADHGDSMGLFRRTDRFDGALIEPGVLASGAGFDEREFQQLLDRVAGGIANTIVHRPWGGGD